MYYVGTDYYTSSFRSVKALHIGNRRQLGGEDLIPNVRNTAAYPSRKSIQMSYLGVLEKTPSRWQHVEVPRANGFSDHGPSGFCLKTFKSFN